MLKNDTVPPYDFDTWLNGILRDKKNALSYLDAVLTPDHMSSDENDGEILRKALIQIGAAHGIPLV